MDNFARHFAPFRSAGAALDSMEYLEGTTFARGREDDAYTESARATGGTEAVLRWERPGAPFRLTVPPAGSGTGRHEMFSVFRTADDASVVVNGRRLPGHPVMRDFFGGRSKSAGLAFSETWVLPS